MGCQMNLADSERMAGALEVRLGGRAADGAIVVLMHDAH